LYFVVGFVLALPSSHVRGWRLAAWIISGVVYAVHIGYEHFRLSSSAGATALHAAMAVALGAFLLAVGATVHAVMVASHAPYWRFLLALVLWPIITAVPAFLVALCIAVAVRAIRSTLSLGLILCLR
jgi:hypothetical protein